MASNIQVDYKQENDPLYKELEQEKKDEIDKKIKEHMKTMSIDDIVDVDTAKVPGQNYALISIVSENSTQKSDKLCMKIRGVFSTMDEAKARASMLQKMDSTFDIYVVDMYSWLLLPPDPELIDQEHVDQKLNEIITGHRESQLRAKMHFEERKSELMNIAIENKESDPVEDITEEKKSANGSEDVTANGENCPNSGPVSVNKLMDGISSQELNITPSKSWADQMENSG